MIIPLAQVCNISCTFWFSKLKIEILFTIWFQKDDISCTICKVFCILSQQHFCGILLALLSYASTSQSVKNFQFCVFLAKLPFWHTRKSQRNWVWNWLNFRDASLKLGLVLQTKWKLREYRKGLRILMLLKKLLVQKSFCSTF